MEQLTVHPDEKSNNNSYQFDSNVLASVELKGFSKASKVSKNPNLTHLYEDLLSRNAREDEVGSIKGNKG